MKYTKVVAFGKYANWSIRIDHHTIRINVQIDHTIGSKEQYSYRLSIDGNYRGDFTTLANAKLFAVADVNAIIGNYNKDHGYSPLDGMIK